MSIIEALRTNSFNYLDLLVFAGMGLAIGIDIGIAIMAHTRRRKHNSHKIIL